MKAGAGLLVYRDGGRMKLREEGRCRMCRRHSSVRKLTRHHLIPKRWKGWERFSVEVRDCDSNIVPLCAACHGSVETDRVARSMLRKALGSNEVGFILRIRDQAWFDLRYPPTGKQSSTGGYVPASEVLVAA